MNELSAKKKQIKTKIHTFYEMKDGKLVRTRRVCPRCSVGYFMADMYDRTVCGRCGYTDFKKVKGKKPGAKATEEKGTKGKKGAKRAKK